MNDKLQLSFRAIYTLTWIQFSNFDQLNFPSIFFCLAILKETVGLENKESFRIFANALLGAIPNWVEDIGAP